MFFLTLTTSDLWIEYTDINWWYVNTKYVLFCVSVAYSPHQDNHISPYMSGSQSVSPAALTTPRYSPLPRSLTTDEDFTRWELKRTLANRISCFFAEKVDPKDGFRSTRTFEKRNLGTVILIRRIIHFLYQLPSGSQRTAAYHTS